MLSSFFASFSCNSMPCSSCSALHGVNPNQKIICVDEQYSKPYKTTFVKMYVFDKFINDVEN